MYLKIAKTTPIIALTAGVVRGEREKCFDAGMNAYMSKPININELKENISELLGVQFS
jgi:CheY-like chemotaxis protein